MELTSSPIDAEVYIDGSFVGNTPSTVEVLTGEHLLQMRKTNYATWERKIKTTSGHVRINAQMQQSVLTLDTKH